MVLYMIGLGLGDERDITLRGLEAVKSCSKVEILLLLLVACSRTQSAQGDSGRFILM